MAVNPSMIKRLAELPESVQEHVFGEAGSDLNAKIILRNGLNEKQLPILFGLLKELFLKDVGVDRLIGEVQKRFEFDEANAKKLSADIAGYQLLPLDKWLGDVDAYLRSLGADPNLYPSARVQVVQRTSEEAVDEVLGAAGAEAATDVLKKREEDLIRSYFTGVRTEAQLKEALMRPPKVGGLGLTEEAANRLIEAAREEKRAVKIETYAPPIEKASPPVPETARPTPPAPVPAPTFVTVLPEDEKEIEQLKRAVLPAKVPMTAEDTAKKIQASIDELYAAAGLQPADEIMQKRLKMIIGNRLRDVRDSLETLETLTQMKELGGMGMSQDEARRVLSLVEAKLKEVHEVHAAETAAEKTKWVLTTQAQQAKSEAEAQTKQETEREKLYESLVAKSKKAPPPAPAVKAVPPPPNLPVATPTPIPPPVIQRPPVTIVRPLQVPTLPPTIRPKIEDVKEMVKLTGPVEELRAITLVDFRRLSRDPKEAGMKIKDKIDLLAGESFEKRSAGIAAWSSSEVSRTYFEMMKEALDGKPMREVMAARQGAKKPFLTAEEMQAVADLSRQLRY